ncbi:c-type cytochrome biogenesis protein CcmI [Methylocystis sp. B8]|uniref:c-type cytochrome biogenesis protein CcmI n=1 Tax=Methylocystis sp. B8 TaxID=544938 RepID=UPI0010FE4C88|nr:c-type cytochrome biogenesis protein CcmI [Methylocystis sp. B8]TLG75083.1 c-type cytochrome biogenesis protein CcmI [Methylocystis sp. B8]
MILWFILTVMTSIAAVFVSAPFIRRLDWRQNGLSSDVAVYRDQLKEVDNEAALGLIDASQAETAKTEIKRRMLAARETDDSALPMLSSGERTFAAIGVAGVVVFGAVGLFALTANLEPYAATSFATLEPTVTRLVEKPANKVAEVNIPLPPSAAAPTGGPSKRAEPPLPPVEEMIQRLVTRLQRNPKDSEGWRTLGWSYYSTDHFTEAAAAYARAIELNPNSADYRNARTDALIRAANGVVTPEAKESTEETIKLHPKDLRARYFQALAIDQGGDKSAALKQWNDLLGELDPNDPLSLELKQKIGGAKDSDRVGETPTAMSDPKSSFGTTISGRTEPSMPPESTTNRGPRPEDIRSAETLAPSDRAAMIQRMVDSLEDRLEQSPRDVDGWIKLIRSRSVLGDKNKAQQTLEKALKVFEEDTAERKRIVTTAQELGLRQ